MITNVYAVFDHVANLHMEPFRAGNHKVALRGFVDTVNQQDGRLAKHPEDYSLYFLGTFDDVKGVYENASRAEDLGKGSSFLNLKTV